MPQAELLPVFFVLSVIQRQVNLFIYLIKRKTMEKKQTMLAMGKKLSGHDMKKIQGGAAFLVYGWGCRAVDDYTCFDTRGECLAGCSIPSTCRVAAWC
jgi:hypothetical protein